jgi:hypothetical protein
VIDITLNYAKTMFRTVFLPDPGERTQCMKSQHFSLLAAALASLLAGTAFAQAIGTFEKQPPGKSFFQTHNANVSQRLATLKTVANPTPAQLPLWNAYEAVSVRTTEERMLLRKTLRAQGVEQVKALQKERALHNQQKPEIAAARKAFFAALTPTQRKAISEHYRIAYDKYQDQAAGKAS